jgi:AcrR family transcriptional regulator
MEDIATAADIGKGTIYLHWKNREAHEVLPHRIMRRRFRQIRSSPLLSAVYAHDSDLLGKLRASVRASLAPRHHSAFEDYLALLGERGLLRDGLAPSRASQAFHAILNGFLLIPNADVDLLGDVTASALEPTGPMPEASALLPVAERAAELFEELAAADRAVLRDAY